MLTRRRAPAAKPRSRHDYWKRRRRIAGLIVLLIVLTPFVIGAWYAKNIADAIGDAQDVAVHDLPTRVVSTAPPTQVSQIPTPTPTAAPTVAGVIDAGTTVADAGASPVSQPSPVASKATESATTAPTVGPTQPPKATETVAPTQAPQPAQEEDNPGSLDVARGLIDAGRGSDNVDPASVWPDTQFLNIMVLGVDTRGNGSDENADTIIIARLDLQNRTLNSISIPRDLQVEIPNHGLGKVNGAYGIGRKENPDDPIAGVVMMRDTLEYNFGVLIDYYVMIDFDGFKDVVDAVGGIEINVPERIVDNEYPTEDYGTRKLVIEAGQQHMDGETALAYARTRHGDSDDQRRERQMQVIRAILAKGQQIGSIGRVADIIKAAGGAAYTNFHWDEQLALASMALRLDQANINMQNLAEPMIAPGTSETGQWIYVGDIPTIAAYIEQVLSGQVPPSPTPT